MLLLIGVAAILQYQLLRPDRSIRQIDPTDTIVPDGGDPLSDDTVPDGGRTDPLVGRRVERIGPNAEVVHRGEDR